MNGGQRGCGSWSRHVLTRCHVFGCVPFPFLVFRSSFLSPAHSFAFFSKDTRTSQRRSRWPLPQGNRQLGGERSASKSNRTDSGCGMTSFGNSRFTHAHIYIHRYTHIVSVSFLVIKTSRQSTTPWPHGTCSFQNM